MSGWMTTGDLNVPRSAHSATLLPDGKVLVYGGATSGGNGDLRSAELYDPATGTWTPTGSAFAARFFPTATLLRNGKVLVAGGNREGIPTITELYDPSTGEWYATGRLNVARENHTATLLPNGKVLVAAGLAQGTPPQGLPYPPFLPDAELYDPDTQIWTPTGDLNIARYAHTATLLTNGKVLVVGGDGRPGSNQHTAELYDPATERWTFTGSLFYPRVWHTATLLKDGKVLVVGGFSTDNSWRPGQEFKGWPAINNVEIYDPASEDWYPVGYLHVARVQHAATLLDDGKVLAEGGVSRIYSSVAVLPLTSAELYDPATATWTLAGDLDEGREFHTATLLKERPRGGMTAEPSKVLVTGGFVKSVAFGTLSSSELYLGNRAVAHP